MGVAHYSFPSPSRIPYAALQVGRVFAFLNRAEPFVGRHAKPTLFHIRNVHEGLKLVVVVVVIAVAVVVVMVVRLVVIRGVVNFRQMMIDRWVSRHA